MERPHRLTRTVLSALAVTGLLTGCQVVPAPSQTPGLSQSTPTASPTPKPSPNRLDFTEPGLAKAWLDYLIAIAGSSPVVMAEVTAAAVTVTVLPVGSTKPVTWAYRDGKSQQVASDLEYVDQAVFDIDDYDLSDVGRLFREAAEVSGSTENQTLHIVDFSGGQVVMTVTTNPESRTVFFEPSGSLLPELDYHTAAGVAAGIAAVTSGRATVQALGVDSETGAWVDYPGQQGGTVRLQRTAKVPVTTTTRDEELSRTSFRVDLVDPAVIWEVVNRVIQQAELNPDTPWSVTVDDRARTGSPRLRFTVGQTSVITDLAGVELVDP